MQYQFSQTESVTCENGLATNDRLPLPNDELCGLDFAPCFPFPLHGSEYEVYSPLARLSLMQAYHGILYLHRGAEAYPKLVQDVQQQWFAKLAPIEKHHAFGHLRL